MDHLNFIRGRIDKVLKDYEALDSVREDFIRLSRDLLNNAVLANRRIASGDMDGAKSLINKAIAIYSDALEKVSSVDRVEDRFFLYKIMDEGLKELVEAILMYNRFSDEKIGLDILSNVSNKVFIDGLFDYIGELRRKFLGYLLDGDLDRAREIVAELNELYDILSMFMVKSYYLRDFRRKLDILRSQLIRSLEDLSNALYSTRGVSDE